MKVIGRMAQHDLEINVWKFQRKHTEKNIAYTLLLLNAQTHNKNQRKKKQNNNAR